MKKGILIVGEENELMMQVLEEQLATRLRRRNYPVEGEYFWPSGKEGEVLSFQKRGHTRKISTDWIVYLEKDMRKIYVHMDKETKVGFYGSMEDAVKQLGNNFCHCHKSYVVNLDKVAALEDHSFLMTDGAVIPIGQRRKSQVLKKYETYQEEKSVEKRRFFESFSCFEV